MIRDLPGATVFVLPEVIRQLKLTDAQQEQIRRIIDAVAAALQELDLLADTATRKELSEKRATIFERARRDAFGILTEEQRLRWQELSETKEAAGGKP
jgi:Spy/CpxP family protein refolding chaperone